MIELFHGGGHGHSASVLMALAEKGLPYGGRQLELADFEQHQPDFLAVNPTGQVPVLQHNGRSLTETFFLLLYLDEAWPEPPLGGADPRARYTIQKWGKYVETHIAPSLAIASWAAGGGTLTAAARAGLGRLPAERRGVWQQADDGFPEAEIALARAALAKAEGRIAEDLSGDAWLAGADYSLADIAVFPHAARFDALGIPLSLPVARWIERVAARPQTRRALGAPGIRSAPPTMGPERGRWG